MLSTRYYKKPFVDINRAIESDFKLHGAKVNIGVFFILLKFTLLSLQSKKGGEFDALTSGALDCLNSRYNGEFDQNVSKKSNACYLVSYHLCFTVSL